MRDIDDDYKEWLKMLYYVWFAVQNIEVNDWCRFYSSSLFSLVAGDLCLSSSHGNGNISRKNRSSRL
jgi:hypothetical protein